MKNFEGFGLSPVLANSLARMNYSTPTPVQEKSIPLALEGRDILGSAQTGTGKTAAFSIPLVEKLLRTDSGCALVLTPTRELAKQVLDVIHQLLGKNSDINTAFIIGGDPMGKQMSQLRAHPRIIVGTPGRINDHLERGSLKLNQTNFLVLDETDRMLDMGFGVQLDKILKHLPRERQTLMFSATLPNEIIRISDKYLTNPERVSIGATNVVAVKIKQDIVRIEQDKKYQELLAQLYDRTGSVIVFVKTKYGADRMAKNLRKDGFTADALHGDLRQHKRDKVMQNFRNQNFRVLVATDIAARGLDVPHIEHVINYDLPQVAEDYIHRMGRTARGGAEGSALVFIASQDAAKWRAIERLLNPQSVDVSRKPKSRSKAPAKAAKPYAKKPAYNQDRKKSFDKKPYDKKPYDQKSGQRSFKKPEGASEDQRGEKKEFKSDFKKKEFKKNDFKKDFKKGPRSEFKKDFKKDFKREDGEGFKKDFKKKDFRKDGPRDDQGGERRSESRSKNWAEKKSFNNKGKRPFNRDDRAGEGKSDFRSHKKPGFKPRGENDFKGDFKSDRSAGGKFEGKSGYKGDKKFGERSDKKFSGKPGGKSSGKFSGKPGGKPGGKFAGKSGGKKEGGFNAYRPKNKGPNNKKAA